MTFKRNTNSSYIWMDGRVPLSAPLSVHSSVCLSGNWHLAESTRRFDSRSITQSAGESVRPVLGSTLVLVLGLAKRGCHAHLLKYLPDTFAQLDSRLLAAASDSALALALQLQLSTLPSYFVCLALFACLFGLVAVILQLGCPLAAVAVVVVAGRTSLVIVFAFCLFAVANDEIELMRPALKASSAAAAAAGAEQTLQTPVETVETLCTAHPKSNTPQSSMDRNRFTVDSLH